MKNTGKKHKLNINRVASLINSRAQPCFIFILMKGTALARGFKSQRDFFNHLLKTVCILLRRDAHLLFKHIDKVT